MGWSNGQRVGLGIAARSGIAVLREELHDRTVDPGPSAAAVPRRAPDRSLPTSADSAVTAWQVGERFGKAYWISPSHELGRLRLPINRVGLMQAGGSPFNQSPKSRHGLASLPSAVC